MDPSRPNQTERQMKALKFAVLVLMFAAAAGCAGEKKLSDADWPFAMKAVIAAIR